MGELAGGVVCKKRKAAGEENKDTPHEEEREKKERTASDACSWIVTEFSLVASVSVVALVPPSSSHWITSFLTFSKSPGHGAVKFVVFPAPDLAFLGTIMGLQAFAAFLVCVSPTLSAFFS
jgi:hypothetical protein